MADSNLHAYSDGDIDTNPTNNPSLEDLVAARYSRRQTMFGGIAAMTTAVLSTSMLSACGGEGDGVRESVTVIAGENGTATSGRVVTLNGTASSNATGTAWSQVSGPAVTLTATGSTVTFIAPSVAASTPLVFRFVANGSGGATAETSSTITVTPAVLGFNAVPKNLNDVVTVPEGYTATVLYRMGDPIGAGAGAFANNGTDTNFAGRAGDHHDGMSYFGLAATGSTPDQNSSTRGLLVMNHENITQTYLHPNGPTTATPRPTGEVQKEMEAHGVSIVEVSRAASGAWSYSATSTLNRRITPYTPTTFSGPVRGNALLVTAYSPTGTTGRGTINNCANGYMPWNTYLTCEENWAGYFRRDAADQALRSAKQQAALARYGVSVRTGNYNWTTAAPIAGDTSGTLISKFNATIDPTKPADGSGDFRNEFNQFGWVVEIDPYDPAAAPRKRTALGRMNHEGAWAGRMVPGVRPAFYMGDDAQGEYIYKFVSNTAWDAADANSANRLAIGDKYLDAGTLYVAKFNADGTGVWIALVIGENGLTRTNATYAFTDQADVLTHCRIAADIVGATRMDRPEWTAVNPVTGEMYCTLTNNSSRTAASVDAANPRAYVDPRIGGGQTVGNANGHIVRLRENGDTTQATAFTWDVYAFGAGADLDPQNVNISGLDDTNDFSSPDGLWFGRTSNPSGLVNPLMWLQTDDGTYTDVTNNQMLVGMPGRVGDGGTKTVSNFTPAGSSTATTRIGALPGTKLRRFMVGPKECEITGIDSTPDGRTLFVNIQHPGENGSANAPTSNWPASQTAAAPGSRPRSATVVVTKNDGGVVGL